MLEGYKHTEVGVIPVDWSVDNIDSLCVIFGRIGFRGYTKADIVSEDQGVISLSPSNIKGGNLTFNNCTHITWEKYHESPEIKIKNDDILLVKTGSTFGKVARVVNLPREATLNPQIVVLKKLKCPPAYLGYLMQFKIIQDQINDAVVGGAIPTLSQKEVSKFLVPIPTKEEQTAIANALSDADALITSLEKLIAKKRAIKTAAMQQLLTGKKRLPPFDQAHTGYKQTELGEIPEDWEVVDLLGVANLIHGKAHEPFVIDAGDFTVVNSKFVSTEGRVRKHCSQNVCPARKGDVLMVLSDLPNGKALAKCYLVNKDHVYAVNQRVCIYRSTKIDSEFLYYKLNRHDYFLGLDDGVTQTHILNGDISACKIFIPKEQEEQQAIARVLAGMNVDIDALEQRLTKSQQLKQGMMQELLTGKTRLI